MKRVYSCNVHAPSKCACRETSWVWWWHKSPWCSLKNCCRWKAPGFAPYTCKIHVLNFITDLVSDTEICNSNGSSTVTLLSSFVKLETRSYMGLTLPSTHWKPGLLSLQVKQLVRESDHPPPSSFQVTEYVEIQFYTSKTSSGPGA
jgi:hypothetical protein